MPKSLTIIWLGLFILTAPAKNYCQTFPTVTDFATEDYSSVETRPPRFDGVQAQLPAEWHNTTPSFVQSPLRSATPATIAHLRLQQPAPPKQTDPPRLLFYGLAGGLLVLLFSAGVVNCLLYLQNRRVPAYLFYGIYLLSLLGLFGQAFDTHLPSGGVLPAWCHARPVYLILLATAVITFSKSMSSMLEWPKHSPHLHRRVGYMAGWVVGYIAIDALLWRWVPEAADQLLAAVQLGGLALAAFLVYRLYRTYRWSNIYLTLGTTVLLLSSAAAIFAQWWPFYPLDGWPTPLYPYFLGVPLHMLLFTLGLSRVKSKVEVESRRASAAQTPEPEVPGESEAGQHRVSPSPIDQALLDQLNEQIEAHLDDRSYDVNTMAASTGKSRTSFHEWFKQTTGTTPAKYLTAFRIKMAHQLLITTNYTVEVIAQQTGFNDGAYLAKKYKQHYGIRPSEARKQAAV